MGMYCLMTCDRRIEGSWPDDATKPICHDDDSPQGRTPLQTREAAKKAGWIVRGFKDICPGCQKAEAKGLTTGFIYGRDK